MALKLINNTIVVSRLEDFPVPVAGVITLIDNVDYLVNGIVNIGVNRIQLGIANSIQGVTKSDDSLVYTGSVVMITGSGVNFLIHTLTVTANTVGASVFSLTGAANSIEIRNNIFDGCQSLGSFTTLNSVVFSTNRTINSTNGLTVNTISNFFFYIDNRSNSNLGTYTALTIGATVFSAIIISRNTFSPAAGQTAFNISTGSTVAKGVMADNIFTGAGTYLTGITHISTGWSFATNIGIANKIVDLFFPTNVILGQALDTPTTFAASAAILGTNSTGWRFLIFRGGVVQDDGAGFTFKIPQDYFSEGHFTISGAGGATTAGNIKLFIGITQTPIGDSFNTLDFSGDDVFPIANGLNTVFTNPAVALTRVDAIITPNPSTILFAVGDVLTIKMWRNPDDAQDTCSADYYLTAIQFTYNAK